ncbi:hypothetical protein E2542_SST11502 [Spatholobus suberectus]|nr:hypothetical protein E2542_SST11502 [Spatholobus suberectus]
MPSERQRNRSTYVCDLLQVVYAREVERVGDKFGDRGLIEKLLALTEGVANVQLGVEGGDGAHGGGGEQRELLARSCIPSMVVSVMEEEHGLRGRKRRTRMTKALGGGVRWCCLCSDRLQSHGGER